MGMLFLGLNPLFVSPTSTKSVKSVQRNHNKPTRKRKPSRQHRKVPRSAPIRPQRHDKKPHRLVITNPSNHSNLSSNEPETSYGSETDDDDSDHEELTHFKFIDEDIYNENDNYTMYQMLSQQRNEAIKHTQDLKR